MITCTMFRHGETEWNLNNKIQGQTDIPLNKKGHQQSKKLAHRLKYLTFDIIFSSDLSRAIETAYYVQKTRNIPIVQTDLLREINFGEVEGMDRSEMRVKYKDLFFNIINNPNHPLSNDTAFTNGETKREAFTRLITLLTKIDTLLPGKRVALSSHGVMTSLIPLFILKKNIEFKNCNFLQFTFSAKNCSFDNIKIFNHERK